jgi:hypothetical protein
VLEWVPRRVTDTDLLEVWIQAVELRGRPASELAAVVLSETELARALETCRRALQRNPFTALKVHWTAGEQEIAAAMRALMDELGAVSRCGGLTPSVAELARKAVEAVTKTREMVTTVEGRRRARARRSCRWISCVRRSSWRARRPIWRGCAAIWWR